MPKRFDIFMWFQKDSNENGDVLKLRLVIGF